MAKKPDAPVPTFPASAASADAGRDAGKGSPDKGAAATSPAEAAQERICVGAIAGAFGVRGEARLKSFCSTPEDIATYGPLWLEDGSRSFSVKLTRPVTGGLGARLSGLMTKEEVDALKGATLWAARARLPSLPDDEFYHTDLIGLAVYDTGGVLLGRVRAVQNFGAGDILEVLQGAGQSGMLMLPFTRAVVPTVDVAAGRIIADPPEELE